MILTPAFAAEHDVAKMFSRLAVHLEPGADPTSGHGGDPRCRRTGGPRLPVRGPRPGLRKRIAPARRPPPTASSSPGSARWRRRLHVGAGRSATARVIGGLGHDVASLRALGLGRRRTILGLLGRASWRRRSRAQAVATVVAVLASSGFPIGPTRAVASRPGASTWTPWCCSPVWRCASSRSSVVPPWRPRWCPVPTFPPIGPARGRSRRSWLRWERP